MITSNRGRPGLALILARDPVEEQRRLRRGQRLPAEQRVCECGVGVVAQLAAWLGLGVGVRVRVRARIRARVRVRAMVRVRVRVRVSSWPP